MYYPFDVKEECSMKLNFREPQNLNHCISICCTEGCSRIPLFHGTRMYALQVKEKDRERFYVACNRVISFAKKLVWNCPVDDEILVLQGCIGL